MRSFAVLSLAAIALIGALSGYALFTFLSAHLLERDAIVSMEFIQSASQINDPEPFFRGSTHPSDRGQLEEFFRHITLMPDVLQATVYSQDQSIIWSSDPDLIGKRFGDNVELQQALTGQLSFRREQPHSDEDAHEKIEHAYLPATVTDFIESYIPIWDRERRDVIGVVEIYKAPRALFRALRQAQWLVVIISVLSGLLLYAILFWIVRRANGFIRQQQHALVEAEKLAAIGELASAVTHSLRNPLAAIRSCAELTQSDGEGAVREYARDIIEQVDRLDKWVRELLVYARADSVAAQTAAVAEVVKAGLAYFGDRPEKQGVAVDLEIPASLPTVRANPDFLSQVLISLIANALEAMPAGGRLRVQAALRGRTVALRLIDNGSGISEQQLRTLFRPLVSYKTGGLGIGLALARRMLERCGGSLELSSRPGHGTTALLQLPAAV
jgi:signal transduction histidine kinase